MWQNRPIPINEITNFYWKAAPTVFQNILIKAKKFICKIEQKKRKNLLIIPFINLIFLACIPFLVFAQQSNLYWNKNGHFSFQVPPGWERINDRTLREFQHLTKRKLGIEIDLTAIDSVFNRSIAANPFDTPYFTVKNVKKPTTNAIIKEVVQYVQSMFKEHIEIGNYDTITDLFINKPTYDPKNKVMIYVVDSTLEFQGTKIFSRTLVTWFFNKDGYTVINFCTTEDKAEEFLPTVRTVINSFKYDDGYKLK